MIKAKCAGFFYPKYKNQLISLIRECFLSPFGPKSLPEKNLSNTLVGAIVPHAGYFYSGACAALAYKRIAETKKNLFIILGVDHYGAGSCLADDNFETPLGVVKVAKQIVHEINEDLSIEINNYAHQEEHSIQVQFPFLQFVKNDFYVVPMIISYDCDFEKLARKLKDIITSKDAVLICSSDFTHYGINYDYIPFKDNVKENLYKLDKDFIDIILKKESEEFVKQYEKKKATICGRFTIYLALRVLLGIKTKQKLLQYYTSGDIINDYSNAVGYASIIFEELDKLVFFKKSL